MRRPALALAASLLVFVPSFAFADEPTAADVDTARLAFLAGLDLRDKQHDLRGAIEKLKAAYALVPTPRIGYELGKTYRATGQLVEARAAYLEVDKLPVRRAETVEAKKARDDSRTEAADLDAKVPSLMIHVNGDGQVTIDGEAIPTETLAVPRRLNPGRHVVALVSDSARARKVVDLREGDAKEITLDANASQKPGPNDDRRDNPDLRPGSGYVYGDMNMMPNPSRPAVLAVGYIGLALGLAADVISYAVAKGAIDKCDPNTKVCSAGLGAKTASLGLAIGGDIAVGVGAVMIIIGLAMPKAVARAAPEVGLSPLPGGGYVSAGGHF